MAKNLKLNIKNLQLAGSLKSKKTAKEMDSTSKEEEGDKKPKARLSRLKKDASVSSALKQAEKTLASKGKGKEPEEAPKKRKSRLVNSPDDKEEKKQEVEAPITEEAIAAPIEETPPLPKEEVSIPEEKLEQPVQKKEEEASEEKVEKPNLSTSPPSSKPSTDPRKLKEVKQPPKKRVAHSRFDSRDRQGLRDSDNEAWRKKRAYKPPKRKVAQEDIIRPKNLSVRLPISIKDLAQEMKLKASQLISKLFMQGMTLTLNDYLDDDTVVQLLGHEFGCEITIDTSEQERINITEQTVREEIASALPEDIVIRSPVIAFMGHVDHGKTSLIDSIRKSNRVSGEAGAITQHIGAFKVKTDGGEITILDTPGHEAFSEMRERGANVTDIVILVVAGDEGIKAQTQEAISQAREAKVPILVAMNKADKEGFDPQKIYRELADNDLLPESWGGTIITVECSAKTGKGISELLEMVSLQAEVLELRANPKFRARGAVLESEMHKGLGAVATVLVQNGTLRKNDAIVFGACSGRIKTMHDEHGVSLEEAGPSTPVKITGLSELGEAGSEFIVVKNDKEAKALAAARAEELKRHKLTQAKLGSMERMLARKESGEQKVLPVILRADVQGSLEALKASLLKIKSTKARIEFVGADVGEISESDVELAAASKATIVGFHTRIETRAEDLIKQKEVAVYTEDVIYHLVDEVKERMRSLLDKIPEENNVGEAQIRAIFKSSQAGNIAGCIVNDGLIKRQSLVRQIRDKEEIWKGRIGTLKRGKDDAKEVAKGFECGIVLEGQEDLKEGDKLIAYEISYLEQDL